MLKKVLLLIVFIVFAGILLFSYRFLVHELNKQRHPLELVPTDALMIIESENLKKNWSHLSETNLVYTQLLNNAKFNGFDRRISKIDSLLALDTTLQFLFDNKTTLLSLHERKEFELEFLMVTRASAEHWESLRSLLKNRTDKVTEEKLANYNAVNFTIIDTDNQYWVVYAPPLIAISASQDLLIKGINQFEEGNSLLNVNQFISLRNYFNPSVALKVFINQEKASSFLSNFIAQDKMVNSTSAGWIGLGLTFKADALVLSGYIQTKSHKLAPSKIVNGSAYKTILPDGILSFQHNYQDDLLYTDEVFAADLESVCDCNVSETVGIWFNNELIKFSFGATEMEHAVALAIKDEVNLIGQLSSFGVNEKDPIKVGNYYAFPVVNTALLSYFGIDKKESATCNYFIQLGDYAVFSSLSGVKQIAATYHTNLTTINENNFASFQSKLLTPFAQSTTFKTTSALFSGWKEYISPSLYTVLDQWQQDVAGWRAVAWQSSFLNDNLRYFSLVVQSNPGGAKSTSVAAQETANTNLLWSITLKNEVVRLPELIKNHQSNTFELVIQDVENVLHLISPTGKMKWSRPLNEPIIGKVNQIDIFNNGKLQFVFNTASKIYCLDINGNNVKGYPIKLPSNASNPVAVMDYENKRDYRYLVATTDNKVLNYDKEGQPVKGWDNKGTKSLVVNVIEHFVAEGKDYLYASDIEGNVYLWERKGPVRHTLGTTIKSKNKQSVYIQRGHSLETTNIIYIASDGGITATNLIGKHASFQLDSLNINYFLVADFESDKKLEFVVPFQNKFYIINAERKIVFADMFDTSIEGRVTLTGKKNQYIIVGDADKKAVVIYNHHFEKLPLLNQPASHVAVVGDLNNDGKDNLITIFDGNKVLVYTLSSLYGM
jgi:hypothetical protein